MDPIKSNQLLNQYPPLDLAEIKSQPLKLQKITDVVAVQGSSLCFSQPPPLSQTHFPHYHLSSYFSAQLLPHIVAVVYHGYKLNTHKLTAMMTVLINFFSWWLTPSFSAHDLQSSYKPG
ncbi:hypothetical protein HanHA300_Chr14g0542331 [Helianthus annuus]|nr:hypothetical protein HanHA300_Chr14g0542331 [Helianthus annuus]KAJ0487408.1 hypothetical protein HanHA89_Chr14g0590071 [Helianthus annuus]KAJ0657850.1 hypothetical protein HanLR1_Chr14g0551271 [Helianthus annuus]KAJ0661516.1 hypothetical protein HanOQP8_Chr14g0549381 [Helianthus annuus]